LNILIYNIYGCVYFARKPACCRGAFARLKRGFQSNEKNNYRFYIAPVIKDSNYAA
jgi:hypothetical protein